MLTTPFPEGPEVPKSGRCWARAAPHFPDICRDVADYDPGDGWHTFRVEVRGNDLKLLIDGSEATSFHGLNRYFANKGIGLISYGAQLQVASYKVVRL